MCKMDYPYQCRQEEWDGSKARWDHCRRCDSDFNCSGQTQRGVYDRGEPPYWSGEHTHHQGTVDKEDWGGDECEQ